MKEGSAQHGLIVQAALRAGVDVEDCSTPGQMVHRLKINSRSYTLSQGVIQEWTNARAALYCDEKQLTKSMLEELRIPHPKSVRFQTMEMLDTSLFTQGQIYICKPEISTNGIGVAFDIVSLEDVRTYLRNQTNPGPYLLEEYLEGHDLRIQVIGGKMVAACTRQPAEVIGNGRETLQQLIYEKRRRVTLKNAANRLDVDEETQALLRRQEITLEDVPAPGQKIQLKRIANMAQGATALDCTAQIDPRIHPWIYALCAYLETPCFAIDIITPALSDITEYKILELNLRAEWMHHTFSEGRQHDLATKIVHTLLQN